MKKRSLAAMLFALISLTATAADVDSTMFAPQETVNGRDLTMTGSGMRSSGATKVYALAMYSEKKAPSAEEAVSSPTTKRVMLVMQRDLGTNTLVAGFRQGMKLNAEANNDAQLQPAIAQLEQVFSRIGEAKEGDRLALDVAADGSATVSRNGKTVDTIPGPYIGPALLKIWLGKNPVSEELKYALLGSPRPVGASAESVRFPVFHTVFDGYSP